jgi:hypothetical protein
MDTKKFSQKEALMLAAKLAQQAARVINASATTISGECSALRVVLRDYDDYIMEWTIRKETPRPRMDND